MDLEVRHLKLVQAIAEEGTVTRAAARLHLTQSALSHQLRHVEERLATRIFVRRRKRMILTHTGERLLRSAATVLDELRRVEEEIRSASTGCEGTLRLAIQCTTAYHWLSPRVKLLRQRFPAVDVHVVAAAHNEPVVSLLEGKLDLALAHNFAPDRRLVTDPLFQDEVVAILPPDHRLGSRPFLRAEDFADQHLLVHSWPREGNLIFHQFLFPAKVAPARVTHVPLTEAIVEMVKAGLGVSAAHRWSVAPHVSSGQLRAVPLTRDGIFRKWYAIYHDVPTPPEYLRAFVRILSEHPMAAGSAGSLSPEASSQALVPRAVADRPAL